MQRGPAENEGNYTYTPFTLDFAAVAFDFDIYKFIDFTLLSAIVMMWKMLTIQ